MKKKRCLVIVAHPDDETIWMGGMILKHKDWEWTIFSLCRKNDKERMPKFKEACDFYGAKPIITNLEDSKLKSLKNEKIKKLLMNNLKRKKYDIIFTHWENGEYGHIRHKEIHKSVLDLIDKKKLKCDNLYCFSYKNEKKKFNYIIPLPQLNSDKVIKLTENQYKNKIKVIQDLYGFLPKSFESLSCNKKEAFIKVE